MSVEPHSFEVRVDSVDGVPVVALRGDLDLAALPILDRHLDPLLHWGTRALVIDATRLDFCGSCGVVALLRARDSAEHHGFPLALAGCGSAVTRVLDVAGASHLFARHDTVQQAVRALRRRSRSPV